MNFSCFLEEKEGKVGRCVQKKDKNIMLLSKFTVNLQ